MAHTFWIVGEPHWRDDWASVTIAKGKRAARRIAQDRLARAEFQIAQGAFKRLEEGRVHRADLDTEAYARWLMQQPGQGGPAGVYYRDYLRVVDGVWLIGPRGEWVHVAEASQAARNRRRRSDQASDRMTKAMLGAMASGLRRAKQ